ncbi:MAG: SDR family oxidoreductase [Spirochaetes bacterium]|nr:SDR family oxidoreductase [Spirochaetota bacterium]
MKTEHRNRTILVTGSSTGIGRATALRLDAIGYNVFASVRKKEDGDALRNAASEKLTPVILDVTDEAAILRARDEIAAAVGEHGLWGLVNNAGISFRAPLEFSPLAEFRRLYDSNVFGLLSLTQAFLPLLRRARGRIINVGSVTSLMVTPFHGIYSSSKMAVNGITDALRLEVRPFGVRVSLMIYGGVKTAIWDRTATMTADLSGNYPPAFDDLYAARQGKALEYFFTKRKVGLTPEEAARPIIHALAARNPRRTYYVGFDAKLYNLLNRVLNGGLRDRLIMRSMGLGGR